MYYSISELAQGKGNSLVVDTYMDLDFARPGGCPVLKVGQAHVIGTILRTTEFIEFDGSYEIPYTDVCARCLEEFDKVLICNFKECFSKLDSVIDEDIYKYEGHKIPLGLAVEDDFILNIPFRDFCLEDCLGLCPKCGCNLNKTKCDCASEYNQEV